MEVGEVEQGNTVPRLNEQEEKIYVAIRVRPLNEREKARHDVSEWECISQNAIRFKNNGHAEQRSSADTYAFDRVFGEKCPTKQVYEQGIKEVALSVVRGINSSIFAYGQTSSGKTYTMTGITELAVKDIYEHIEKHKERQFIVKFSALEIYNEAVRDLLNSNSTTLRLLDDPEKGTVVDKLTEETLTERSRLQQLISKCAAERTTEETAMNETSSRSHQILRLTVESNPSDFVGTARSNALFASVNFVDLAGSERASQALSAGTRLREGSHINRSLLTLGTVIRKLSKERNGHIPYRDSKLTRILHNSLGGNARTAIICTISPARSQVEQSKNTLFFAGCAKQVTTNARVNIVMSDKVLVKQLQKELARMENELKSLNTTVLKERELQIEQMDKEIKELTRQRDLFQNLLQSVGKDQVLRVDQDWASQWSCVANDPSPVANIICENLDRSTSSSSISSNEHLFKQSVNSEDNFLLDGSPPTFVGPDPCQGWEEMGKRSKSEDSCNEVPCFEIKEMETEHKTDNNTAIPVFEESEGNSPMVQFVDVDDQSSSGNGHSNQEAPQHKTEDIKRANNHLVDLSEKSNDSFESEPCCLAVMSPPRVDKVNQENSPHPQFGKLEQNVESSSGNGHSNQDAPHQKTEDIIRNNDHLVDLSRKSNDLFESEPGCPGCLAAMSPPKGGDTLEQNVKSTSGNGNSDQDAPHQETEYDHLVDLSKKSNDSFESEPCCLAVMSPPRVDKMDQENSPHPQFGKLEQNVESSSGNGHSNQDAPHQKTEDIIRNNDHLVDLSRKSNDLFESEPGCPGCLAAMSPPKGGDKLEQNVKSTSGNGNSDQDAPHQETEYDHLVDLSKKSNDSFESEPCCLAVMSPPQVDKVDQENSPHPQFGKLEQNVESSSGNGHSNQDAPHQKTEDIIRNNDHLVDLSRKSNDPFESEPGCPGCLAAMSPPKGGDKLEQNVKSSSGNGHSDQDAPHQETEDGHLVDLSKKSNDSFEFEPCCLATKSPPQVDKVDQENSLYPQFGKLEQNVESSSGNGHNNQDTPHQKTEDIIRNNDHLVDLSRKSNDPFESEPDCPGCLAAMSPPKGGDKLEHNVKSSLGNGHSDQDAPHQETEDNHLVDLSKKSNDSFESESEYCCFAAVSPLRVDKVDQENSPHPRLVKLEQNVSPSFNKLDQEPMSPLHQSEQEELESMSPPQRDDLEQVSFKSSASEENEYSTSLVCFPEKLSEPKLRAKRRRYSRKSLVHERNASVEDVESVVDSDDEETSSVVNLIARMNESAKPKPADNDIDYRMVPVGSPQINKSVNRVKGLSFSGVWGDLIPSKFEMQQRDIIELWDACHVPLVHRSYFFLLIKGELSDSVYLDVELRRLSFLKDAFSSGNYITGEGLNVVTPNSSFNSLTRERKMLSKQVHKKFSRRGREELYQSWGIDLKTKHRSIQLAWLIWTDTRNLSHIRESAALVGKLVGFINTGETPKKTFGLGFLTRLTSRGSQNWNDTMSTP